MNWKYLKRKLKINLCTIGCLAHKWNYINSIISKFKLQEINNITISMTKFQKQIIDKIIIIAEREEWKYTKRKSFGWWGGLPIIRVISGSHCLRQDHTQHP